MKFLTALIMIGLLACDDHNSDLGPVFDLEVVTIPNAPAMINPAAITGTSFNDVQFTEQPGKGQLEVVTERNFVKYIPNGSFIGGNDIFQLEVVGKDGETTTTRINVRILQANECSDGGIFDYIKVEPGEDFVIDLLANDVFCGGFSDITSGGISMYDLSVPEGAGVAGIHLDGVNEEVTLSYTSPDDQFTGTIEFVYEVGINGPGAVPSGSLSDEDGLNPNAYEKYIIAQATIEIAE